MSDDDNPPNVLIVHCHDLGCELGCYDRGVDTPNVDQLAEEGVRFDQYLCSSPLCSPSRGSIVSGQYPHINGLVALTHRGGEMNPEVRTLPEYLRDAGYHTAQYGVLHAGDPGRLGFETVHECYRDIEGYDNPAWRARDVAERFKETLDDELLDGEAPFYAHVGFDEPHAPFRRSYHDEEFYDRYEAADVELPPFVTEADVSRETIVDIHSLIAGTVDPAVGRIYEALATRDALEDTLVIFTADHGLGIERGKNTQYIGGAETPLIMRHPDLPSGKSYDELLSNVDLLPTILDFVDIERTQRTDGRSFLPLLEDRGYIPRDHVFVERTGTGRLPRTFRAIRTPRFTFVKNYFSKRQEFPAEELFDRREDPYERENLLDDDRYVPRYSPADPEQSHLRVSPDDDEQYVDVGETLRSKLAGWMRETDDPLADGCLPIQGLDRDWAKRQL